MLKGNLFSLFSCCAFEVKGFAGGGLANSGLPSKRTNLSPFTKDFRGGGQLMSQSQFFVVPGES